MTPHEKVAQKAKQLEHDLNQLPPERRTLAAIRSSQELAIVIADTTDAALADELAELINARLDGVNIPTCIAAICSTLAQVIGQISSGGEGTRLVLVGAVSGILGHLLKQLDMVEEAEAEAATATKQ